MSQENSHFIKSDKNNSSTLHEDQYTVLTYLAQFF